MTETKVTYVRGLEANNERLRAWAEDEQSKRHKVEEDRMNLRAEVERQRQYIAELEDLHCFKGLRAENERLQAQVSRDNEHYQAAMAMAEKHRKNWVEACQEREQLRAKTVLPRELTELIAAAGPRPGAEAMSDTDQHEATPRTELEKQIMDPHTAKNEREWWAAAEIDRLRAERNRPWLGLATTRELLDELRARIEMHALGGLDYRTVDGEKFAEKAGEARAALEHKT